MRLDHVAVSGETRQAATEYVETALQAPLQPGGQHAHFGTHNTLLGLEDGLYLEAISIDPAAPALGYPRWFGLDDFSGPPRLTTWICQVDDLEGIVSATPEAGEIVVLQRGDLRWRMAVPPSGHLPFDGLFPALIQWDGPHPAPRLTQHGVGLTELVVSHPNVEALRARLAPWLADEKVRFETGSAKLTVQFATPHGVRAL